MKTTVRLEKMKDWDQFSDWLFANYGKPTGKSSGNYQPVGFTSPTIFVPLHSTHMDITFDNSKDAMLLLLRWGGQVINHETI